MINSCFDILDSYKNALKDSLISSNVNEKDIEYLLNNFKFNTDLILSLNREYVQGKNILEFCKENNLDLNIPRLLNFKFSLYKHQENAIKSILEENCTIISTGTGSGKTESFLIPIIDYCIKNKEKKGVKAIIIYPMNALATDQLRRIALSLSGTGITYGIFNGETPKYSKDVADDKSELESNDEEIKFREEMILKKPDILITNHVMLDRILTSEEYSEIFSSSEYCKYMVLDEIHIYRGTKGLNIKYLLNRLKKKVSGKLVQIGCSATLNRSKSGKNIEGYISGEIEEFIKTIFSISPNEKYQYIEPIYKDILKKKNIYDNKFCNNISEMEVTKKLKKYLNTGSKSIEEILNYLNENNIKINEYGFREYLNNLYKANIMSNKCPVLDFRMHIFLINIKDTLRRCTGCNCYYTQNVVNCNKCGELVLPVYRKNPKYFIGALIDNKIEIPNENNVKGNPLVLLDLDEESNKDYTFKNVINFDYFTLEKDKLNLEITTDGKKKLYLLDKQYEVLNKGEEILNDLQINLQNKISEQFIYKTMNVPLLETNKKEDRKVLAFIDNREKSSRLSVSLGDRFISKLYYEILKYVNNSKEPKSILNLIENTQNTLNEVLENYENISERHKYEVKREFIFWIVRYLKKVCKEKGKIVKLQQCNLSKIEEDVLNVVITEGAFGNTFNFTKDKETNKLVRIALNSIKTPKYVGLTSKKYNEIIISLSDRGVRHRDLIERYTLEEREWALKSLLKKKLLFATNIIDDKNQQEFFYNLNLENFSLIVEESQFSTLTEILDKYLLFAGLHNSEVNKFWRKDFEDQFQKSELNILFSTPTLEMGIDIGRLTFVYMIGIPPMPSNYAQRAGRAGRKGNRFAALINFCSEKSSHDWYYFNNPKEIIEGCITPPKFDKRNKNILRKHINAVVIPMLKEGKSKKEIEENLEDIFNLKIKIRTDILREKYLTKNQNWLYNNTVYPNYGFNKDDIELIDKKTNEVIATRNKYQAYLELVPYQNMYIGGKYYRLFPNEKAKKIRDLMGNEATICKSIICRRDEGNAEEQKKYKKAKREIYINSDSNLEEKDFGPISISIANNFRIQLSLTVEDAPQDKFIYELIRNSIIIRFDKDVISLNKAVSLVAALDRTIKYEFGLDENELGIIIGEKTLNGSNKGQVEIIKEVKNKYNDKFKESYVVIFYESTGTKTVDMDNIYKSIVTKDNNIIFKALNKIKNCECDSLKGCYLCLKSYNTQMVDSFVSKEDSINVLEYLANKNSLIPYIEKAYIFDEYICDSYKINILHKGDELIFKYISEYKEEIIPIKNNAIKRTIINTLSKKFKEIYEKFNDQYGVIEIRTKMSIDLNKGIPINNLSFSEKKNCLFEYYQYKFNSLPFKIELIKE